MRTPHRTSTLVFFLLALLGLPGVHCQPSLFIQNYDATTGYVEFSQSGYALMLACADPSVTDYVWEFFEADGTTPMNVAFYDVGAATNAQGILVDEKFTGTSRPHRCWQSVDLHAAGVIDFANPGPPPHGYVRLTSGQKSRTYPFRVASTTAKDIQLVQSNLGFYFMDKPYRRWFHGDEVVRDLLQQRALDPERQVLFMGFNQPQQSWAGSNEFFFEKLGDGRNLQEAVEEAFDAVDAFNATAAPADRIARGWFGVDYSRIELARKQNPALCCVDDGTGECDEDDSITAPREPFLGCGGPYGSAGGPQEWCGTLGTSTCHEADGSYGGLEGVPLPGGGVGAPDALTHDRLIYIDQAFVTRQNGKYGVVEDACGGTLTDFRKFDRDWHCEARGEDRCLYGPDAGDLCSDDDECTLGFCRPAVPLWYGEVSLFEGTPPTTNPFWGLPRRCNNPYGYCQNDPYATCESSADCGGTTCVLNQTQGRCIRSANAPGLWDHRDGLTRSHLVDMYIHQLQEGWNLRPGTNRDHFTVVLGGEALLYYDRGTSCRGDRPGCNQLASSDNTLAHKSQQFAYPKLGDQKLHYRNPAKPGEYEYFDSELYRLLRSRFLLAGYSNEAFLVHHGSKYVAPGFLAEVTFDVRNFFWWMTEPARNALRNDGRGNRMKPHALWIPSGLNSRVPEPRADSSAYGFRSDETVWLGARHASIDDGQPVVGVEAERGAMWSAWRIDPAANPAANCPNARFVGTGASMSTGVGAVCTTRTEECVLGSDGLCLARDTCGVDPANPAWGTCRSLVVSVFDYDNRGRGICSENGVTPCHTDLDCAGICQTRPDVGADNIQRPVALVDLDAVGLGAKGGLVEMDFGGAGCRHSDGVNVATFVGDPASALCDATGGMRDVQGRAHVEVLDQASPLLEGDVVVLEGTFQKLGASAGAPRGTKLGFGFASGAGWGPEGSEDSTEPYVKSAATRRGPQLGFDGAGVFLACGDRASGQITVDDQDPHAFTIRFDRAQNRGVLTVGGQSRSCQTPPGDGPIGGFLVVPHDDVSEGGPGLPFDLLWSNLSLRAG